MRKLVALRVNGYEDYAALLFEQQFGKTPSDITNVLNNLEELERLYVEENELEDSEDVQWFERVELNCDEKTFRKLQDVWGDYDYMKTENVYLSDMTV